LILRNSRSAKPENINPVYGHIVGKTILPLIIQVGNASNLILKPDLYSYYAMDGSRRDGVPSVEPLSEGIAPRGKKSVPGQRGYLANQRRVGEVAAEA